jgi:hypothetical protein
MQKLENAKERMTDIERAAGRMDESAVRWPRIFVAVATIHLLQLLRFVLAWLLAVVMV